MRGWLHTHFVENCLPLFLLPQYVKCACANKFIDSSEMAQNLNVCLDQDSQALVPWSF